MTKDQLKAKYGRIANDDSQLTAFKDDLIDGEIPVNDARIPQPEAADANKLLIVDDEDNFVLSTVANAIGGTVQEMITDKADLVDGKVPSSQLPSYVDDVVEYASLSNFPAEGEQGKIYLAIDTGLCYRWSGSEYIQVAGSTSVLMFASQANFPTEGEEGVIYVAEDTNKQYRWNGTAYVELSAVEPLSAQDIVYAISLAADPVLNNNSWATIAAICAAGKAAEAGWQLGDTKTDVGTDGKTRTFRICDMYNAYEGRVVFEQVELEQTAKWDAGNVNDYESSDIRISTLPAILVKYSNDLQASITTTSVKVAKAGNDGTIVTLSDKLFLSAEAEIFGSRTYSKTEEYNVVKRFDLYANNDTNDFRKKYLQSSAERWWLRSPYDGSASNVCIVYLGGTADYSGASAQWSVAPFFSF